MIRLFHVYFPGRTLLLAVTEAFVLATALVATMFFWLGRDVELIFSYEHGVLKVLGISLICMLCMYYYDLYDSLVLKDRREVLTRLVQVLGTSCIVLALVFYLFPGVRVGRGLVLSWVIVTCIFLPVWRSFYLSLARMAGLMRRTLLLGGGALADALAEEIASRDELGLRIRGFIPVNGETVPGARCLGSMDELEDAIARERINHLIISMEERRGNLPVEKLLAFKARGLQVEDGTKTYEAITGRVPLMALRPSTLLLSEGFQLSQFMLFYKRVCGLLIAGIGLILASPIMLLTALAVRLDSPGPILFRQKRVGRYGKIFELYKFRSMYENSEAGSKPAEAKDKRFTRVGRWIRRTRIDELPQLYNILAGDMDFIGPRPFTQEMETDLAGRIPFYSQRWNVKPGATGWAQVQRGYCVSLEDNIEKLSYDLFYIKNVSVGLDCLILFQTIKILLLGRGAR
jgi:sugar transferase (PEP-CTERM system associated)